MDTLTLLLLLEVVYYFTKFQRDSFADYKSATTSDRKLNMDNKACSQKAIDDAFNRYQFGSDLAPGVRTTR